MRRSLQCSATLGALCLSASVRAESFLWLPYEGRRPITCDFTCYAGHRAIDFGLPTSTQVSVAAGGEVTLVRDGIPLNRYPPRQDYGNQIRIRHANGYTTIYAHFAPGTLTVRRGDRVIAGQLLGLSDNTGKSTGPHLHFEVRDPQGRRVNPYGDPPDYNGGCGPNALWVTCPPTSAPPPDADGDGYTTATGDCDDGNRDVHPDAEESCNDRDDDCNGTRDDPWRIGLAQDIGNSCTVGIGACGNAGTWACTPDGRATACNVDPLPSQPEACNSLDDDCDGAIDEDWRTGLSTDLGDPCTMDWGPACGVSAGSWVCAPDGRATVCDARERPSSEICNNQDDDCNDITDDVDPISLLTDTVNCGACGNACRLGEFCGGGYCGCVYWDICQEWCEHRTCGCDGGSSCYGFRDCMDNCSYNPDWWDAMTYAALCSQGCVGLASWPP